MKLAVKVKLTLIPEYRNHLHPSILIRSKEGQPTIHYMFEHLLKVEREIVVDYTRRNGITKASGFAHMVWPFSAVRFSLRHIYRSSNELSPEVKHRVSSAFEIQ